MKKLFFTLTLLTSFSISANELQINDCTFGEVTTEFTPSASLTALYQEEVKGAVVYKVKYRVGSTQVGPKSDMALVDELPSKSLEVSFFDFDSVDGIFFMNNKIAIDLKAPVSVEAPLIRFEADLNDEEASIGNCSFVF